jgi:predicted AAA+ superfamily ATPase
MAFSERRPVEQGISLTEMLAGDQPEIHAESSANLSTYTEEIVGSGFPGIRGLPPRARRTQLDSYVTRILDHDLEENGITVRRPGALRAWLTAYAAATSTTASYAAILDAATPGEGDKPARQTVAGYRESLERLFLLDPLPAWVPSMSSLKGLAISPKHHLVDPALAARLMGVDSQGLLRGRGERIAGSEGPLLGALFESLAAQSVRVFAQSAEARVSHLRTKRGEHEVDLVVEGYDRRVVALEVKLNPVVTDREVRHLLWLRKEIGGRMADMAVLTTGPYAYRRPDGVAVVPLALLGA